MELIDIGANLAHDSFDVDRDAVMARARAEGVVQMVITGSSEEATRRAIDLSRAHPDIRACVSRIDIMRLGHAMPRPVPGFLSAPGRAAMQAGHDGVFYAHSDVSGLPLFEEAQYRGVTAADAAIARLGRA